MQDTRNSHNETSRKAAHIGQVQKHAFNSDRSYRLLAWRLADEGKVV